MKKSRYYKDRIFWSWFSNITPLISINIWPTEYLGSSWAVKSKEKLELKSVNSVDTKEAGVGKGIAHKLKYWEVEEST